MNSVIILVLIFWFIGMYLWWGWCRASKYADIIMAAYDKILADAEERNRRLRCIGNEFYGESL